MTHVFISYAREDGSDFASTVIRELEKNEFEHWIDSDEIPIGDDFQNKIDVGIRDSFAVIIILTPSAAKSDYVRYEWIFALGAGIKVIPLQFLKIEKSDLHPAFQNKNWADFSNPKARPWNEVIKQLKQAQVDYNPHNIATKLSPFTPQFVLNALAQLESTDEKVRLNAIDELAKSNHVAALEAIAQAVRHHLPDVRIRASLTLASKSQVIDERALPGLQEALESNKGTIRVQAANALERFNEKGIPILLESLDSPIGGTRELGAQRLGKLKAKIAVPKLVLLLDDPHIDVANATLEALDNIGDKSIIPVLKDKLKRDDDKFKLAIAQMLYEFEAIDDDVIAVLVYLLGREPNNVGSPAADLLFLIGNEVIPKLIDTLEKSDQMFARSFAAEILGYLNSSDALPSLIQACNDSEAYVRVEVVKALGRMKAVGASDKLIEMLNDPRVQNSAEWALEMIDTPKARETLAAWRKIYR